MSEGREAQVAGAPAAICETRAGTEARPLRRARLFSWRTSLAGILHLVAIWVIVVVVWCLANDRVSPGSWHVPLSYGGDSLQMLTWFRAASELDYVPFVSRTNSRLGAPYRANWDDYPMYEAVVTFLIGMVARWTDRLPRQTWAFWPVSWLRPLLSTCAAGCCVGAGNGLRRGPCSLPSPGIIARGGWGICYWPMTTRFRPP